MASTRTMLVAPIMPPPESVIAKLCTRLDYEMSTDPAGHAELALFWDPNTWRDPPHHLERAANDMPVINLRCRDFSKTRVDEVHAQAFGRSLRIDPTTTAGAFVVKSDRNATHDGRVVTDGAEGPGEGAICQRLVNNQVGDGMVVDLRTPVIGGRIPLVYKLYRPLEHRFSVDDTRAEIVATADTYSAAEHAELLKFSALIGMDYGELDVLRDRESGQIWVVDANPTPWGPARTLSEAEHHVAVEQLSEAFHQFADALVASRKRVAPPA